MLARPGARPEDRRYQLPRLPAAGRRLELAEGRPRKLAARPWPGTAGHAGDGRPGAGTGDARSSCPCQGRAGASTTKPTTATARSPARSDEGKLTGDDRTRRPNVQPRGGAGVDFRTRSGAADAGREARRRSLRHAVLPARLRLCGRHAVPVDGERLLADGRNRMRHRQAAPSAGGGQRAGCTRCRSFRNLWEHIGKADAQEGAWQGHRPRPAQPTPQTANRPASPLRPLRKTIRAVAEGGYRGAALLHRRVQQHRHLEAGLRLHFGFPARQPRRLQIAGQRPLGVVPQLPRGRHAAWPPAHAAHRQRAA